MLLLRVDPHDHSHDIRLDHVARDREADLQGLADSHHHVRGDVAADDAHVDDHGAEGLLATQRDRARPHEGNAVGPFDLAPRHGSTNLSTPARRVTRARSRYSRSGITYLRVRPVSSLKAP